MFNATNATPKPITMSVVRSIAPRDYAADDRRGLGVDALASRSGDHGVVRAFADVAHPMRVHAGFPARRAVQPAEDHMRSGPNAPCQWSGNTSDFTMTGTTPLGGCGAPTSM
jgi:hypothetical protein